MQISTEKYNEMTSSLTGKLVSVVCDGYDFEQAVEDLTSGKLKERVISSGGTLVIRPDSGVPVDVVMKALSIAERNVGYTINSKGYKVLHPSYRIIQGDGVNPSEILRILSYMESKGWSAENIAFGMGGGLLQQLDRDTGRWAMKMSAAIINDEYVPVFKMPKTDPSKKSKAGFLDVIAADASNPNPAERGYVTFSSEDYANRVHPKSIMQTVFENGETLVRFDLGEMQKLSDAQADFNNPNEWKVK